MTDLTCESRGRRQMENGQFRTQLKCKIHAPPPRSRMRLNPCQDIGHVRLTPSNSLPSNKYYSLFYLSLIFTYPSSSPLHS
ncbi:hypothetical protein L1887_10375 [Cichorium endivia]|nr:hypothetical protein L1887_10375 [Cichorium endivia]